MPPRWVKLFEDETDLLLFPPLRAAWRLRGPRRSHDDLAEEVAARVWWTILARGSDLLRAHDPNRGRLGTLLGRFAYVETLMLLRSQSRRRRLELRYGICHAGEGKQPSLPETLLRQEILPRLTATERRFFQEHLLHRSAPPLPPPLRGQLRFGIRRKIVAYLQEA